MSSLRSYGDGGDGIFCKPNDFDPVWEANNSVTFPKVALMSRTTAPLSGKSS